MTEVKLNCTFDAQIWVQEWLKTIEKHPDIPNDEGTMLAWFANAIMAGYDHAYQEINEKTGSRKNALREKAEADKSISAISGSVGNMSDGHHTFDELYEHRHLLFINLTLRNLLISFKTKLNDKKEEWDGWFILGMNTEFGQVTYHLPISYWDVAAVREVEYNFDYDGHTAKDVIDRLALFAKSQANSMKRRENKEPVSESQFVDTHFPIYVGSDK